MRIGQEQRVFGGDHNPEQSYRGKFTKINMWSTILDGSVIVALSRSPGAESGDVISWGDTRTALINGNVMVQEVASMQLTGDTRTISYHSKRLPSLFHFYMNYYLIRVTFLSPVLVLSQSATPPS